jgi:hypothetical protein
MSRSRAIRAALDCATSTVGALRDALDQLECEASDAGEAAISASLTRATLKANRLLDALAAVTNHD